MGSQDILSHGWDGGNIFLLGFMGSGKTHWGKKWAAVNGLHFIDLDEVIERKAQMTISKIFEASGEEHFRTLEAEALRECAGSRNTIIACGGRYPLFSRQYELDERAWPHHLYFGYSFPDHSAA
jgi:shikimate kinase